MIKSKKSIHENLEDFPQLSPGEIHVWQVSMNVSPSKLIEFKNALSERELKKSSFFEFEKVKTSFIISQGTLRILLSNYLNIPTDLVKLGRRKKGKPYSIDDPTLFFNLSNSGDLAVIAFSRDSEVGIDIEKIRPLSDLDEMIARNFTNSEIKFITGKAEEKSRRFFRFWTIKESYLKAIGEGMRLSPKNIEFAIEKDGIKQLSVQGVFEQEDWNLKEFTIAPNYVGTLAFGRDDTKIKQLQIN